MLSLLHWLALAVAAVLSVLAAAGSTPSPASTPAPPTATASPAAGGGLPRSLVLAPGETARLPDGAVLAFVELVEDSRCPSDVVCVWAGQAVVALSLGGERFELTLAAAEPASATLRGYTVRLEDVRPYPRTAQPTSPSEVHIAVSVSRP